MKNWLMKCIETFLIYIFLNDVIVMNFILGSPFHIFFLKNCMDFVINHMFRDIHWLV
jgi:hypothetical protein